MLDTSALRSIARTRLRNRWVQDSSGGYFRLQDGDAVRLSDRDWREISADYEADVAAASRRMNRWFWLTFPVALGLLYLNATFWSVASPDGSGPKWWGALLFCGAMGGMPVSGMVLFVRARERATEAVMRRMRGRPRCKLPPLPDRRALNILEMLAWPAVIVAALQVVGTLAPNVYRNTPLVGTELNFLGAAAIASLVLMLALKARHRIQMQRL